MRFSTHKASNADDSKSIFATCVIWFLFHSQPTLQHTQCAHTWVTIGPKNLSIFHPTHLWHDMTFFVKFLSSHKFPLNVIPLFFFFFEFVQKKQECYSHNLFSPLPLQRSIQFHCSSVCIGPRRFLTTKLCVPLVIFRNIWITFLGTPSSILSRRKTFPYPQMNRDEAHHSSSRAQSGTYHFICWALHWKVVNINKLISN